MLYTCYPWMTGANSSDHFHESEKNWIGKHSTNSAKGREIIPGIVTWMMLRSSTPDAVVLTLGDEFIFP